MSITSTTSMSTEILSASKAARTFGVRVRTLRGWARSGLSMRPFESDGRYYVEIAKAKLRTPDEGLSVTTETVSTPVNQPPLAVSTLPDPPTASKTVPASEAAASGNKVPAETAPAALPGFFVYPPALRRLY